MGATCLNRCLEGELYLMERLTTEAQNAIDPAVFRHRLLWSIIYCKGKLKLLFELKVLHSRQDIGTLCTVVINERGAGNWRLTWCQIAVYKTHTYTGGLRVSRNVDPCEDRLFFALNCYLSGVFSCWNESHWIPWRCCSSGARDRKSVV